LEQSGARADRPSDGGSDLDAPSNGGVSTTVSDRPENQFDSRSELRSDEAVERELVHGLLDKEKRQTVPVVYYPGIRTDIEDAALRLRAGTIVGVDPFFSKKETFEVKTSDGKTIPFERSLVKLDLKSGRQEEVTRFVGIVPAEGRQVRVVLYGANANYLAVRAVPEMKDGYDMFYVRGWSFPPDTYREGVSGLNGNGLFVLHVLPAGVIEEEYRSIDELEESGILTEGSALVSSESQQLYISWKKSADPASAVPGNPNTLIQTMTGHPVWLKTSAVSEYWMDIYMNATDPALRKKFRKSLLDRAREEADPRTLRLILDRLAIVYPSDTFAFLSRLAAEVLSARAGVAIPEEEWETRLSAIRENLSRIRMAGPYPGECDGNVESIVRWVHGQRPELRSGAGPTAPDAATPLRRAELRLASKIAFRALADQNVPDARLGYSARVIANVSAEPVIRELTKLRGKTNSRANRMIGHLINQLKVAVLEDAVTEGYAVAYSVGPDTTPMEISDFADAILSFGVIKQIVLPSGQRLPDSMMKRLRRAGITISYPGLKQKTVFRNSQEVAGLVMTGPQQAADGRTPEHSSAFVPVISVGQARAKDPQLAKLVTTVQTAIAVLLAHEIRKDPELLKAELIGKLNAFFGNAGVVFFEGDGFAVSADALQKFLTEAVTSRMTAYSA
jgi:hypothetical protein